MHRSIVRLSMLAVAAMLACTTEPGAQRVPARIVLSPDTMTLLPMETRQLSWTVFDQSGNVMEGAAVLFESADPTHVSVTAGGMVRGIGPTAATTVTVHCDPATQTTRITVLPWPARIQVSPTSLSLGPGDTVQVQAVVLDSGGAPITGAHIAFSSTDSTVASVSAAGLVRALYPGGSAFIMAQTGPAVTGIPTQVIPPDSLLSRVPVTGGAYGIAVSQYWHAYVTAIHAGWLFQLNVSLTGITLGDSIATPSTPVDVQFSADGATAYVASESFPPLRAIDVASNTLRATLDTNVSFSAAAVSPDGATVLATSNNDSVYIVNTEPMRELSRVLSGDMPNAVLFSPDGRSFYVSNSFDGSIKEFDLGTSTLLRQTNTRGSPQGLTLASSGSELWCANQFGWVNVWSTPTGARLDSISLQAGRTGFGIAKSPDEAVFYVTLPDSGLVRIIGHASRRIIKTLRTGGRPRRVAFTPDGRFVLIANEAGWVDMVAR
jgi:DNA-binding beta-propeller fold protein YncE